MQKLPLCNASQTGSHALIQFCPNHTLKNTNPNTRLSYCKLSTESGVKSIGPAQDCLPGQKLRSGPGLNLLSTQS